MPPVAIAEAIAVENDDIWNVTYDVEAYPAVPRPATVDMRFAVERNPAVA